MRFRNNPFLFTGLLPLLCSTQGLPGDGASGGGTPPAAPPAGAAADTQQPQTPPAGDNAGRDDKGQFQPAWLNERVAQAKRNAEAEVLKRLGVSDVDAAAKAIAKAKELEDASKSELQRKDDRIKALEPHEQQAKSYRDALDKRAQVELARLPPAAQERIKAIAGDDPIKVLESVDLALAMSGQQGTTQQGTPAAGQQGQPPPGQSAPAQGSSTQQQGKPPVPPAANTSGALGGPPSANGSPPDHLAIWKDMQTKNPMAAAHYFIAHQDVIVAAQQQQHK